MDLDRSVSYRLPTDPLHFDLNDAGLDSNGAIRGCQVHSADYSSVDATGYMERRANSDGLVANDIYLGVRRIQLVGTVYGATRAEAHDRLQALCASLNPRLAFNADPGDKGFLPLAFDIPTEHIADDEFPSGWRSVYIKARSVGMPSFRISRDASAGEHYKGLGIPWSANMQAIDPRIYGERWQHVIPAAFSGNSGGILVTNRGDYPSPLNLTLKFTAAQNAGEFWFGGAGTHFKLTVPDEAVDQVLRFDGDARILTQTKQGIETLRMDLLYYDVDNQIALVQPGESWLSYEITSPGCAAANPDSVIWFNEAYA